MNNLMMIGIGAGGAVAVYALMKAPAAKAKLSAWWNAGKLEAAKLKGDVAAHSAALDTLKADVDKLKAKVGV